MLRDSEGHTVAAGDFVRPASVDALPHFLQHRYGCLLGTVTTTDEAHGDIRVMWDGNSQIVTHRGPDLLKVQLQPYMLAEQVRTAANPSDQFLSLDRVSQEVALRRLRREQRRNLVLLATLIAVPAVACSWWILPTPVVGTQATGAELARLTFIVVGPAAVFMCYRSIRWHKCLKHLPQP